MKNLTIVASLVAVFSSVGLAQAASTGTITFNGELTASTCEVAIDGQNADATVVLPTVGTNQLSSASQTAGETGFVMALNNCSGTLQTASAFFEAGASVDSVTGRLTNLSGTASNVSLQLLDGSNTNREVIQAGNSNQAANTKYQNVTSGSATLPYAVRYYAEGATTAGSVITNVVYSIQYQ